MNLRCSENRNQAMTLLEVFVVVLIFVTLIAVLWPRMTGHRHCALHPTCSNSLKQIGLAFKIWEGDNNDKFPMGLSVTNGGTRELMETTEAWRTFQVMSNELSTPLILLCPQDSTRTNLDKGFGDELKSNISYFISAVPDDSDPQSILSGDDNFRLNNSPISKGNYNICSNSEVAWDSSRHFVEADQGWYKKIKTNRGYLLMADGSVQLTTDAGLKSYLQQSTVITNRFAIP